MTDRSLLRLALISLIAVITASAVEAAEIRGRINLRAGDEAKPRELAGLDVRAVGIIAGGGTVVREAKTDTQGEFHFADLSIPGAYLVVADYRNVGFHADGVRFDDADEADARREIEIEVHHPTSDPSAIVLENIRLLVEQEAGAYRLDHQIGLRNTGNRVVLLDPDKPSPVQLALVPGHENLVAGDGIEHRDFRQDGDRYVLVGPVYPGGRVARIRYEIPVEAATLDVALSFAQATPEFELYILDEGISVDVGPLHPARIARDEAGNSYLHYLGFDLNPDSDVPLRVSPRVRVPAPKLGLVAILAAVLGAGIVFVVGRPLLASEPTLDIPADTADPEAEALALALRDLEYDFETGKLSAEDRDELRRNLERDSERLQAKRRGAAPAQVRATQCPKCQRGVQPADQFCSGCGAPL